MSDFEAMYKTLFNSATDATELLLQTQQDTEEIYVSALEPDIRRLELKRPEDGGPDMDGRE